MRSSARFAALLLAGAFVIAGLSSAELQEVVNAPSRAKGSVARPHQGVASKPVAAPSAPAVKSAENNVQVASAAPTAPAATAPAWSSRCSSAARQSAPECVMEQTAVLNQTGQVVTAISVRLPSAASEPVMMIQVPVGLFLPAGITLQVDERPPVQLTVQTCDLKGCYAGLQIPQDLLGVMKTGKKLAVTFQNLARQNMTVPMTLAQFAEAYQRIQ